MIGLVCCAALVSMSCSADAPPAAAPSVVRQSPTSTVAVVAKADAPQVCARLADSQSLLGLSDTLIALVSGDANAARSQLRAAAGVLRDLSSTAGDGFAEMTATATALEALADDADVTDQDIDAIAATLSSFGEEVQAECEFPLG